MTAPGNRDTNKCEGENLYFPRNASNIDGSASDTKREYFALRVALESPNLENGEFGRVVHEKVEAKSQQILHTCQMLDSRVMAAFHIDRFQCPFVD